MMEPGDIHVTLKVDGATYRAHWDLDQDVRLEHVDGPGVRKLTSALNVTHSRMSDAHWPRMPGSKVTLSDDIPEELHDGAEYFAVYVNTLLASARERGLSVRHRSDHVHWRYVRPDFSQSPVEDPRS